ncbi:LHPP phosphatase, partial [Polyodon spathula]|nr:LHPP phosphatase [Polyodon spathula]
MAEWKDCMKNLKGVLLDICGVLYDSGEGGGVPIPGSIEAVKRIKASGLKLRFCTNETQATRDKFVAKLQRMGFDISVNEVFSPAPAACKILKDRGLRPHLLVYDEVVPEFAGVDKSNPNCVVVGDAADNFSYKNVNEAFRVLIGLEKPVLISLGRGRYYKETDGLKLDVGVYMKALEYACDIEAEVVGKPAKMFFQSALADMGVEPQQAIMIGDDLVNDVGGAQQCGMKALQVRTGKYRSVGAKVTPTSESPAKFGLFTQPGRKLAPSKLSADDGLLTLSQSRLRSMGKRAFSCYALKLWNALPQKIKRFAYC